MGYTSNLPDAAPLTPARSADLLRQLGAIKDELFLGHCAMIRKLVWKQLKHHHGDWDELGEHLESVAIAALWEAVTRAKPQRPGFAPYAYFEACVSGALKEEAADARKHQGDIDIQAIADVLVQVGGVGVIVNDDEDAKKLRGIDKDAFWDAVDLACRKFPAEWQAAFIVSARANKRTWKSISAELNVPVSTLRDRHARAFAEIQIIFGAKPQI